jgi:hypothetical protein
MGRTCHGSQKRIAAAATLTLRSSGSCSSETFPRRDFRFGPGSPAPPRLTRLGRLGTRRPIHLAPDTNFVDVLQEVGWIFIDAVRAGTLEFVLAVAAREETNAKGTGALRS